MIKPLGNRVLIKYIETNEKTKSGIILGNDNNSSQIAKVIAIGNNVKEIINKGDNILISKYSGSEVNYEGDNYIVIDQNDILAIVGGRDE